MSLPLPPVRFRCTPVRQFLQAEIYRLVTFFARETWSPNSSSHRRSIESIRMRVLPRPSWPFRDLPNLTPLISKVLCWHARGVSANSQGFFHKRNRRYGAFVKKTTDIIARRWGRLDTDAPVLLYPLFSPIHHCRNHQTSIGGSNYSQKHSSPLRAASS